MMSTLSICIFSLVCVLSAVCLKETKKEYAFLLSCICSVVLLKTALGIFSVDYSFLTQTVNESGLGEYGEILLKTLGISLCTQTTSDICRENGQGSVSSKIELIGKAEIFVISIPLITKILELTKEIIL